MEARSGRERRPCHAHNRRRPVQSRPRDECEICLSIIQGYKNGAGGGVRISISDDLNLSGLETTASYSPDRTLRPNERVHLKMDYHYWDWRVSGFWNSADFYDLFGPTRRAEKGTRRSLATRNTSCTNLREHSTGTGASPATQVWNRSPIIKMCRRPTSPGFSQPNLQCGTNIWRDHSVRSTTRKV